MSNTDKSLHVTMSDGSVYAIPMWVIERSRAQYVADREDISLQDALVETREYFEDEVEIFDWASGNMNWDEVAKHASLVAPPTAVDFQDGWVNGDKKVV